MITNSYEKEFNALVGSLGGALDIDSKLLCTYDIRDVREINGLKLEMKHKVVLWALDSRGANIYPNQKTIAEDCGMSPSTVQRAISDLVDAKIIYVQHRAGTSNSYMINRNLLRKQAQEIREANQQLKHLREREIAAKTKDWDIK